MGVNKPLNQKTHHILQKYPKLTKIQD